MPEQSRMDANDPEQEFSLTVEEAADRYTAAGHPRTPRAVQKYCKRGHLQWRWDETPTTERYLVTPASVARHIAQINDVEAAKIRRRARTADPVRASEDSHAAGEYGAADVRERSRSGAAERDDDVAENQARLPPPVLEHSRPVASELAVYEHPYVKRLEAEVEEFKDKHEKQVRRTEEVLQVANKQLIELQQANAISNSETLAKYMLALNRGSQTQAEATEVPRTE